jgi:protein SCO1/2
VHSRQLIGLSTLAVAALAAVLIVAAASRDRSSSASPESRFEGATMPAGLRAPGFALHDQNGKPISMAGFRGQPVIVTFLYSHCKDTCPVEAKLVDLAIQQLRQPTAAIAVSVDPRGDTPQSVRRFMAEQGIKSNIRWVLGSRRQLAPIWKGYAVTAQTKDEEHLARVTLVDKKGFQKVGYPFDQTTPARIAHDMKMLAREKS